MKSRLVLLLALASAIGTASVYATTASAGTFNAGIGECFLPQNVYGGSGPTITAPSVWYRNRNRRLVKVRAFAIIVNAQTGRWMRWQLFSTAALRRGERADFPRWEMDVPSRSTAAFWPAAIRVRLEVFSRGSLVQVQTGKPYTYKIFTNGAFHKTFAGWATWC